MTDRQKMKRLQLEQQVRDLESKMRGMVIEAAERQRDPADADCRRELEREVII